ncbi:aminopeptidase [Candidatus Aenigmatarchaeota archaeon]
MTDPRIDRFAKLLVGYSTEIREGDNVRLIASPDSLPLLHAIYREVLKAGANPPHVVYRAPGIDYIFQSEASEAQLGYLGAAELATLTGNEEAGIQGVNALISIQGAQNTRELAGIAPERSNLVAAARRPIMEWLVDEDNRIRWCGTMSPYSPGHAQDGEMSVDEWSDLVFASVYADREDPVAAVREMARKQAGLYGVLDQGKEVHIRGRGTDLRMSIEGMKPINEPGKHNQPDGEVFTGPVVNSVRGYITFQQNPVVRDGREVHGVRLEFDEHGRCVQATADKNEAYLNTTLDMDEGARRVGELGIGTNFGVPRFVKNILFDEKRAGTLHMAMGNGYPPTGNSNESALHWDMIMDLGTEGHLSVDGREIHIKDEDFYHGDRKL